MVATSTNAVNVIGFLSTPNGIGQAARGYARAFRELKWAVACGDISHLRKESELAQIGALNPDPLFGLNLIVANPFPVQIYDIDRRLGFEILKNSYNIGSWWWEIDSPPPMSWQRGAEIFDEIWAGTEFIKGVFEQNFEIPVRVVPPLVELVPDAVCTRDKFSWQEKETIFLFLCDFFSIAERKNPLAVIKAFRSAFHKNDNARLVIKVINESADLQYWQSLKDACGDARISLINQKLSRSDVDSMMNLADCYVSLHRAEGFGLTLAESMLGAKPVIGTAYSGNMDFMDADNSYLVPYRMVEIEREHRPYSKGSLWADPDFLKAGEYMREVYEKPDFARVKAERARNTIQEKFSASAIAAQIHAALGASEVGAKKGRFGQSVRIASSFEAVEGQEILPSVALEESVAGLVSVCLPVFNGRDYLSEAIESVLAQTYTDFELIISDDGSSDGSLELIKQFAQKDIRIKYWQNQSRLGLFDNYNRCMQAARGEFVKPFAQDDVLDKEFLQRATRTLSKNPSIALFASRRGFINEVNSELSSDDLDRAYKSQIELDESVDGFKAIKQCFFPVMNKIGEPATVMFRRAIVGAGFDSTFHHTGDLDYWFRLLQQGNFFGTSAVLCYFRMHGSSTSMGNIKSLLFALDLIRLGKKHENVLSKMGRSVEDYMAIELANIAGAVQNLTEGDLYFGAQEISASGKDIDPVAFRDLAFLAFRRPGPPASVYKVLSKIEPLEREVRSLLSSPSWMITKPLRDFKKLFLSNGTSIEQIDKIEYSALDEHDYFLYLASLRSAILASGSWSITSPLRKLKIL